MPPGDYGPIELIDILIVLFRMVLPGLVALVVGLFSGFFLPKMKTFGGLGVGFLVGFASVCLLL